MRWMIAGLSLLGSLLSGCGGDVCAEVPASCPSEPPTYSGDVRVIVQTYCLACHAEGGEKADLPLDTYDALKANADDVSGVISTCEMPPEEKGQPSADERQKVLAWIVCGANDD